MKAKATAGPLPVLEVGDAYLPELPDDLRVRCRECSHASGYKCIRLRCAVHVLPVHCDSFNKRVRG